MKAVLKYSQDEINKILVTHLRNTYLPHAKSTCVMEWDDSYGVTVTIESPQEKEPEKMMLSGFFDPDEEE